VECNFPLQAPPRLRSCCALLRPRSHRSGAREQPHPPADVMLCRTSVSIFGRNNSGSRRAARALAMATTTIVPKGSLLGDGSSSGGGGGDAGEPAAPPRLSVLSYNLLAPLYVRPIDRRTGCVQEFAAFPWCGKGDELLDFAGRWPRLLAEIRGAVADIVCLQEVSEPEFHICMVM
jgi:hypothetical protein